MKQIKQIFFGRSESDFKDKMKNGLSIKLCQKNLLTDKKMRWAGKIFKHVLRAGEPRCLLARLRSKNNSKKDNSEKWWLVQTYI